MLPLSSKLYVYAAIVLQVIYASIVSHVIMHITMVFQVIMLMLPLSSKLYAYNTIAFQVICTHYHCLLSYMHMLPLSCKLLSISPLSSKLLLKDSDYIGIFYCFFSFGTIPITTILLFHINPLTLQISETASHSATTLHSYIDPYPTMCSARFGVDSDFHSGSRAKSVFSDSPHFLQKLSSDLQLQYL